MIAAGHAKPCIFTWMKYLTIHLSRVLIGSSLVLLLTLQGLWLRSSYENEVSDLKRECNTVFKNTIFQLRDSVFFSNVNPTLDSMAMIVGNTKVNVATSSPFDTIFVGDRLKGVQMFMSSRIENDSLSKFVKPFAKRFLSDKKAGETFTIRIEAHALNIDTLRKYFKKNLEESNIWSPFFVDEIKFNRAHLRGIPPGFRGNFADPGEFQIPILERSIFNDTLKTEPARLNPGKLYSASLVGIRLAVAKKIMPQIVFSIFLFLVTAIAFVVLYRGLKTQQRLMQLKNDFVSNMTHELKTPITTVGVAIEALKNFNGIENRELTQEYLAIAQNELSRLSLLTDKILKTAIFESKGVDFQAEQVDLAKIIDGVMSSLKLVFEKNGARVAFCKTGSDFRLEGSTVHLTNVVFNLLDNALKYGSENPKIEVELADSGTALVLSVRDNGIGIASEYQKKIFEKFFRVPAGDVHNNKGYGLGLSYVDSVVKAHKATIEVESKLGNGSMFIVKLRK
jgi:signal transduction histidine kinase